ncbi:MAG: hypothetical protein IJ179_08550 [Oscillospiraceae bacterium]|nr:hypothetical protein [Oscillospiraceae bacterium]
MRKTILVFLCLLAVCLAACGDQAAPPQTGTEAPAVEETVALTVDQLLATEKQRLLADGYTALSHSEYAATYAATLLHCEGLPEAYRLLDAVYVKAAPCNADEAISVQLCVSEEEQAVLWLQQTPLSTSPGTESCYLSLGRSDEAYAEEHPWARHAAFYQAEMQDTGVALALYSVQALDSEHCSQLFSEIGF